MNDYCIVDTEIEVYIRIYGVGYGIRGPYLMGLVFF